jgi:hypothetical protein
LIVLFLNFLCFANNLCEFLVIFLTDLPKSELVSFISAGLLLSVFGNFASTCNIILPFVILLIEI